MRLRLAELPTILIASMILEDKVEVEAVLNLSLSLSLSLGLEGVMAESHFTLVVYDIPDDRRRWRFP